MVVGVVAAAAAYAFPAYWWPLLLVLVGLAAFFALARPRKWPRQ